MEKGGYNMIKPLLNRVVLLEEEPLKETASGIVLGKVESDKKNIALVVETGPTADTTISKGMKVVYDRFKGTTLDIDDQKVIIIEDKYILATIQ